MFKREYKDIFGRLNWKHWSNSENILLIKEIRAGVDIHDLTSQFALKPVLEDRIEIIRHCRILKDVKRRFRRLGPDEAMFLKKYSNLLIPSDFSNIFEVSLSTVLLHAENLDIKFDKELRYERVKNKKAEIENRRIEMMTPKDAVKQIIVYMKAKEKGANTRSISQDYIGFRRLKENQQKAVLEYLVKDYFKINEKQLVASKNKDKLINANKFDEIDYTIFMYYRSKQPKFPVLYQIFETVYPGKTKFWEYRTYWTDELIAIALKETLDKNQIKIDQDLPKQMSKAFFENNGLAGLWNSAQKRDRCEKKYPTAFVILDIAFPGRYKIEQFDNVSVRYWSSDHFKKEFKLRVVSFLNERGYLDSDVSSHYIKQIQNTVYQSIVNKYPLRARKILRRYADDILAENMPKVFKPLNINRNNRERLLSTLEKSGRNTKTCEVCDLTEPLEVHHIIDVAVIKKTPEIMAQIGFKNIDDIDNLIVLCENHHSKATKQKFYKSILTKKVKSIQLREMLLKMFAKDIEM